MFGRTCGTWLCTQGECARAHLGVRAWLLHVRVDLDVWCMRSCGVRMAAYMSGEAGDADAAFLFCL